MVPFDKNDSPEELKSKIVAFLSDVEYSELITVDKGIPHNRPMVYANDGIVTYMVSKKNTSKVNHIKNNPNVSVVIIKSLRSPGKVEEVSLEGKAYIVSDSAERDKAFSLFQSKPKVFQTWLGKVNRGDYDVIRIEPSLMKYFDYSEGDGTPFVVEL